MRAYTVHLLFHLIAIIIGGAAGLAASVWWVRGESLALWLALAALLVGLLLVVLHGFYVRGDQPPAASHAEYEPPTEVRAHPGPETSSSPSDRSYPGSWSYPGSRSHPGSQPRPAAESGANSASSTRVDMEPLPEHDLPREEPAETDEERTKSATEALNEHWNSHSSGDRS